MARHPLRAGKTTITQPWPLSAALALLLAWGAPAAAEPVRGTWFLAVDNDVIARTDDHYTSGLQLGWVSGYLSDYEQGPVPGLVASALNRLPLINREGRQRFISHSLSHRVFTPMDTETTELQENDVPYSGMLFATLTAGAQDAQRMDAFSFYYGIAGPSAQGRQVQNDFHRVIGSDQVRGWDNQIGDEPLLNIAYEHRRRLAKFGRHAGWGGDVIGQTGATLGNLMSMATLGVGARFGWRVPDDYGIPPQFFGEETIGSRPYSTDGGGNGAWLFVLLNGSVFGNAIFWDGNTFKDSHSVDYDPAIGRLYVGLNVRRGRWGTSLAITKTTVPWENPSDRSLQTYGRLGLAYSY